MRLSKGTQLLTQLEFLNRRISLLRERVQSSSSEISKEFLNAITAAFAEIGTIQQALLKRISVMEAKADEEKERYRSLFDLAPAAYVVTDRDGHIRNVNEAAAGFFQGAKEWFVGRPLTTLVSDEAREEVSARLKISSPGAPQCFDLRALRLDGTAIDVSASLRAVQYSGELLWSFSAVSNQSHDAESGVSPDRVIGTSAAMLAVKKQIEAVSPFPSVTVLLEGETGTGKEVIAEALHNATFGRAAPFIPINCPAIPDHLLESELFGYEKGAFTDARSKKPGLFELAHGGTLFLDEVGSLSANLQPKLLRVLETKTFSRLGGLKRIKIYCRIIAATNKPLRELVEGGKFREDLYQRLSTFTISIPPLRERREDISLMARVFIDQAASALQTDVRGITPEALAIFEGFSWPGNVRELKKIIERAVILTPPGQNIDTSILPREMLAAQSGESLPVLALRTLEKQHLAKILAACGGNRSHAAKLLGISRTTLRKKLKS